MTPFPEKLIGQNTIYLWCLMFDAQHKLQPAAYCHESDTDFNDKIDSF